MGEEDGADEADTMASHEEAQVGDSNVEQETLPNPEALRTEEPVREDQPAASAAGNPEAAAREEPPEVDQADNKGEKTPADRKTGVQAEVKTGEQAQSQQPPTPQGLDQQQQVPQDRAQQQQSQQQSLPPGPVTWPIDPDQAAFNVEARRRLQAALSWSPNSDELPRTIRNQELLNVHTGTMASRAHQSPAQQWFHQHRQLTEPFLLYSLEMALWQGKLDSEEKLLTLQRTQERLQLQVYQLEQRGQAQEGEKATLKAQLEETQAALQRVLEGDSGKAMLAAFMMWLKQQLPEGAPDTEDFFQLWGYLTSQLKEQKQQLAAHAPRQKEQAKALRLLKQQLKDVDERRQQALEQQQQAQLKAEQEQQEQVRLQKLLARYRADIAELYSRNRELAARCGEQPHVQPAALAEAGPSQARPSVMDRLGVMVKPEQHSQQPAHQQPQKQQQKQLRSGPEAGQVPLSRGNPKPKEDRRHQEGRKPQEDRDRPKRQRSADRSRSQERGGSKDHQDGTPGKSRRQQ